NISVIRTAIIKENRSLRTSLVMLSLQFHFGIESDFPKSQIGVYQKMSRSDQ
ncbi:hypothetical protein L9F63_000906, partial [Diploptera punctata]